MAERNSPSGKMLIGSSMETPSSSTPAALHQRFHSRFLPCQVSGCTGSAGLALHALQSFQYSAARLQKGCAMTFENQLLGDLKPGDAPLLQQGA